MANGSCCGIQYVRFPVNWNLNFLAPSADRFCLVQKSYEQLTHYLEARDKGLLNSDRPAHKSYTTRPEPKPQYPYQHTSIADTFYSGPVPDRKLLLGHFLYYSGAITWREVTQSIVWQRMHRPRLGVLANRFGWMTQEQVLSTIKNRKPHERFGESALNFGFISRPQLNLLIFTQKRDQKKIGIFFIEHNILSSHDLIHHVTNYHRHNCRMRCHGR